MWEYSSLYHSGVEGMRWGLRRWQNADGTLTEAGKARYRKTDENGNETYDKAKMRHDKDMDSLQEAIENEGVTMADKLSKSLEANKKNISEKGAAVKKNEGYKLARNMSDEELSSVVKRMSLEKQFAELNSKNVESGYEHTMKNLTLAIEAVEVVGGALAIAAAVRKLGKSVGG